MQKISKNLESKLDEFINLYCTGDEDVPSTDEFLNYISEGYEDWKSRIKLPDPWVLTQRTDMPLIYLKDIE